MCTCTRACLLACLLQDALDNVWKAHQTLGGEPYPQARMQHLLIVFGTLLVRFMQVGWSGVGTPVGHHTCVLMVVVAVGVATCFLHVGSWGRVPLGRAVLLGSRVSHSAVAFACRSPPCHRHATTPSPPSLCVHLRGQVLIGASNVWTGAFNTVRTSLKEGVLLCEAWTNTTQRLCTQAWASSEDTHR